MKNRGLATALILALIFALAACGGARAPGASSPVTPPRMLRNGPPDLEGPPLTNKSHTSLTVMIDTDGHPEMSTLRLSGTGGTEMSRAITEWIARSMFAPAMSNGVPVRAEYHLSIKMEVRRVVR